MGSFGDIMNGQACNGKHSFSSQIRALITELISMNRIVFEAWFALAKIASQSG